MSLPPSSLPRLEDRLVLRGRLVQLVPVLIGITLIAFLLLRVMPGDPATLMLGARGNAEDIAALTDSSASTGRVAAISRLPR